MKKLRMAYDGAGHRISMTLLRKICDGAGSVKAAYDYRATVVAMRTKQQVAKCCPPFGEQVTLSEPTDKVTETFTGIRLRGECCEHACMFIAEPMGLGAKRKERDDETALNYFGARYLDPMLGLWISVDPARQFSSPYLYAGNGYNPIVSVDEDGNDLQSDLALSCQQNAMETTAKGAAFYVTGILTGMEVVGLVGSVGTVLESILKL